MKTSPVMRALAIIPVLTLGACEKPYTKAASSSNIARAVDTLHQQTQNVCSDPKFVTFFDKKVTIYTSDLEDTKALMKGLKEMVSQYIPKVEVGTDISMGLKILPGGPGMGKIGGFPVIPATNVDSVMAKAIKPDNVRISIEKDAFVSSDGTRFLMEVKGCGPEDPQVMEKAKKLHQEG